MPTKKPRKLMSKKTANALGLPLPRELTWAPEKPAATRRGRPRLAETRGERFGGMRLSADELAAIERAAKLVNRKPGDFVRVAAVKLARELIAGREILDRPEPPPPGAFSTVEELETVLVALEPEPGDGPAMLAAKARQARDVREQLAQAREREGGAELASATKTAEPAHGGGLAGVAMSTAAVAAGFDAHMSKSVAKRLAHQGGPPPACSCGQRQGPNGSNVIADHATGCARRAYLETLLTIPRT
jgi:uncharacterized protein (DUF1778 family)